MIEFRSVCKSFGEKKVIKNLSLSLPDRGAFALLGPSGSGKTTFLRLAAGLETPDSGTILRGDDFSCAFCFQEDRLLPWRTIGENIALALTAAGTPKDEARMETAEWLKKVGLPGEENSYPAALSGGMKRRASLARCLAFPAPVLMLDEPFRALDEATHLQMLSLVRECAKDRLLLLVTHDERDAGGMEILRI